MITIPASKLVDETKENLGGLHFFLAWALWNDIKTHPAPVADDIGGSGDLEETALVEGNIVMNTGKVFKLLEITQDSAELKSTGAGETDGMAASDELTFFVPGNRADITALFRLWKNTKLVFLVPDKDPDQVVRLMGNGRIPARVTGYEFGTGKDGSGRKGATFTAKMTDVSTCPVFTGKIQLTEGGSPTYQTNIPFVAST